jgi:hypothetical protein
VLSFLPNLDTLKSWQRRLLSNSEATRLDALSEIFTYGIRKINDKELEKYVREDRSFLRNFVLSSHLNTKYISFLARNEITQIIRKNWPLVEYLLKHPSEIRERIHQNGKGSILYSPEGYKWLCAEMRHLYVFLRTLSYDVYCPVCKKRVDAMKPIIVKWSSEGKILDTFHIECCLPKDELKVLITETNKKQGGR